MTDVNALTGEAPALPIENAASDDANTQPEDAHKVTDEGKAESSPAEGEKDEGGKKPHWATRRIDELTRNWREAERRNDQLMGLIGTLQGKPATQAQVDDAGKPPTLEQFGYDEAKYQAALLKFAETIADKKVATRLSEWEQKQQQAAKTQTFKQREAEFAGKVEDYTEVVYDPTVPITPAMAEAIADSDIGPELAYHIASNRSVATRLAALSPMAAARELGRIEARLVAAKEAPKPVTKAPPPPPKVEAKEAEVERDPDAMPIDEWVKWREKQLRTRK